MAWLTFLCSVEGCGQARGNTISSRKPRTLRRKNSNRQTVSVFQAASPSHGWKERTVQRGPWDVTPSRDKGLAQGETAALWAGQWRQADLGSNAAALLLTNCFLVRTVQLFEPCLLPWKTGTATETGWEVWGVLNDIMCHVCPTQSEC